MKTGAIARNGGPTRTPSKRCWSRPAPVRSPWSLVEGNDKYWARTRVLSKLVKILSTELKYEPSDPLGKAAKKKVKAPEARH